MAAITFEDSCDEVFEVAGIDFADLGTFELGVLVGCVQHALRRGEAHLAIDKVRVSRLDVSFDEFGELAHCDLWVTPEIHGPVRAISFHEDRSISIGFHGEEMTGRYVFEGFERWCREVAALAAKHGKAG